MRKAAALLTVLWYKAGSQDCVMNNFQAWRSVPRIGGCPAHRKWGRAFVDGLKQLAYRRRLSNRSDGPSS